MKPTEPKIITEETPVLAPGTPVSSNNQEFELTGTVEGIAMVRQPVIGFLYIIRLSDDSFELLKQKSQDAGGYGYRCIAVPEVNLNPIN